MNQAKETHRPILLTSRGRGVAVVQSLDEYENREEEREFMKTVAQGLMELEEGKEVDIEEAKKRIGLK
ncbi:MAG: type II toxin-antitoxin system prevent-host-death family antitoxin [Nitrosomonas sp.]|nr:type II toxin-antitoxin system prevent-host-death family antitoxin [Nitrosomonas sp.]